MSGFIGMPTMGDIERLKEETRQLREAVIAMAIALGATLPSTPEVTAALSELAGTDA